MRLCDPLFCRPRDDEYDEDLGYQEAEEVDLGDELAHAKKALQRRGIKFTFQASPQTC
jgi:hypothetical protein